jgi:hypothetical protein
MAEDTTHSPQQTFEWIESEYDVPEIYCNFINCSWTLVDVRLQIGELIPKKSGDTAAGFVVEERGSVTMGWYQAKVLRDLIASLIASYEQVNGEIAKPQLAPVPTKLRKTTES